MDAVFKSHVDALPGALERLVSMRPVTTSTLPPQMPQRGIYVLSEGIAHLYVGRSNRLRTRLRDHAGPTATHRQAAFAFRLAREATGNLKATYKRLGSRGSLMEDPAFVAAFNHAKGRIGRMDVRFIDEDDPVRQCLMEVYAAIALRTPYNDFDNH